jgi:hypothetical protein
LCLLRDAAWYAGVHALASNFYDSELSPIRAQQKSAPPRQHNKLQQKTAAKCFFAGRREREFASELLAMHN